MQISIWEKETFYAPRNITILGSGFAGLWSAYFIKKSHPGYSVAIVDRGIIPTGASTRNAGFACFGSLTELVNDAQQMGEDKMLRLVEMRFRGLERIRNTFTTSAIDFDPCGGFEMITSDLNTSGKNLDDQIKWLNDKLLSLTGIPDTFIFSDQKIAEFGFRHVDRLIENKLEGSLHPGKLCQRLIQLVRSMGVEILSGIEVTGFEKTARGVELINEQGINLITEKLLICTNAFTQELLPGLEVIPARGQVLVTSPIPHLKIRGAFHFDEGYYYFRNLGNRILLGGARNKAFAEETTTAMDISSTIQGELENFLSRYLIPGASYQITDRWSGIMGVGPEKIPIIRQIDEQVFCAVRMSGIGVAITPVIGEQVAQMMMQ